MTNISKAAVTVVNRLQFSTMYWFIFILATTRALRFSASRFSHPFQIPRLALTSSTLTILATSAINGAGGHTNTSHARFTAPGVVSSLAHAPTSAASVAASLAVFGFIFQFPAMIARLAPEDDALTSTNAIARSSFTIASLVFASDGDSFLVVGAPGAARVAPFSPARFAVNASNTPAIVRRCARVRTRVCLPCAFATLTNDVMVMVVVGVAMAFQRDSCDRIARDRIVVARRLFRPPRLSLS